jgi:superfamily II DNA or RNA helicase
MNDDIYYELELNETNLLAPQPDKIKMKLKPHQLTSLNKAIHMETKGSIKYMIRDVNLLMNNDNSNVNSDTYTNITIGTNVGILGDTVGYGKTLLALSLIASNNPNNIYINPEYIKSYSGSRHYNYLNITMENNLIKRENNIINSTLVIVPRGPVFAQWEKSAKENTKLRVLSIPNYNFIKTNIPRYDGHNKREIYNYFERYDLVLIKNTTFKILYNDYFNSSVIDGWKRIMVDEAHDIVHQLPETINYYYLWLISGTFVDILKKSNNSYSYGIKRLLNESSINLVLVKNNIDFIKKSFNLPEPIEKFYLCKLPSNFIIAKKFLNNSIMEKINANDFAGAIKELGGKNETEDNIIELVSKELKRELHNLEMEKVFISNQDISQEDKDLKIKNINVKIENQQNKINDLTERIKSLNNNNCSICMDTFQNPVMLDCTHLYCGACIFKWVKDNKNCPYCRNPILSYDKLIAIVNEKTENKETQIEEVILTKEDRFINIVKNKPDGKFIVFSKNDFGYELVKMKMIENNIKYEFLKGNTSHMLNILEKFKNGDINVILLNTQYAGSGIDINYATDVIIFHSMGIDKQQAIGRAQRVGRKNPLYIHNLIYEHEN